MRLVIDAGVAVKWLVAEEGSDAADRLLANGDDLYAPRLMASEVANALWRKVRLGEIERSQAGARVVTADAHVANALASTEHGGMVTALADRARAESR